MIKFFKSIEWRDIAIILFIFALGCFFGKCMTSCKHVNNAVVNEEYHQVIGNTTTLSYEDIVLECNYQNGDTQYYFIYMETYYKVEEADAINYFNKEGSPILIETDTTIYITTTI